MWTSQAHSSLEGVQILTLSWIIDKMSRIDNIIFILLRWTNWVRKINLYIWAHAKFNPYIVHWTSIFQMSRKINLILKSQELPSNMHIYNTLLPLLFVGWTKLFDTLIWIQSLRIKRIESFSMFGMAQLRMFLYVLFICKISIFIVQLNEK